MEFKEEKIPRKNNPNYCEKVYSIVKVVYDSNNSEDLKKLKNIEKYGKEIANKVKKQFACDSTKIRDSKTLEICGISGYLAEWSWYEYLNNSNTNTEIKFTEFNDAKNQIDLICEPYKKTIEVRSSFVNN